MRSFRHTHPSPNDPDASQFMDPLPSDAHSRQESARAVVEARKDFRNTERREKRAKEELREANVRMEDMGGARPTRGHSYCTNFCYSNLTSHCTVPEPASVGIS